MDAMDIVGPLLAAGAGSAIDHNLKRRKLESISFGSQSLSECSAINNALVSDTEYGENRRSSSKYYRLHAAKYLKCDHLLKELLFPLQTIAHNFGFCSTTGSGRHSANQIAQTTTVDGQDYYTPANYTSWAKANGLYRGLAVFTIRTDKMPQYDDYKLNSQSVKVGTTSATGDEHDMYSAYRRFNNAPVLQSRLNAGTSPGGADQAQTLEWGPSTPANDADGTPGSFTQSKMSISEVGNLVALETASLHASNFGQTTVMSLAAGTTATASMPNQTAVSNWNGTDAITYTANGVTEYRTNLRDTTVRIADGFLQMDITNGKNSACLIELVINSQKKQRITWSPQDYFDEVYQSVEFQQTQKRNPNTAIPGGDAPKTAPPGGWQAFYDPEYPLLKVKSAHRKKIDDMMTEVHRSSHMLAPGQSKLIKIALGSLYYSIGNKTTNTSSDRMLAPYSSFNPGSLLICIGHSGVNQLTMPSVNTATTHQNDFTLLPDELDASGYHQISGAGFWVGKQKAPSEIVVSGRYAEKYYPSYAMCSDRNTYDDTVLLPPYVQYGGADHQRATLGAGLPVQEVLGTVDATAQNIASNVATSIKKPT